MTATSPHLTETRQMGLTPPQLRLLQFLKASIKKFGSPPTFDEIMAGLGMKSKSGVHRLLRGLECRGAIRRIPGYRRAIEIVQHKCPHCGHNIGNA